MELTPQEKIMVFKEELKKQKENHLMAFNEKMALLTKEDREKVLEQFSKKPSVFLNDYDIVCPKKDEKLVMIIFCILGAMVWFMIGVIASIVFAIITSIIIFIIENNSNINTSDFYKIKYMCPKCNHNHMLKITQVADQNSLIKDGLVEAKCQKCGCEFNIYSDYFLDKDMCFK